MEDIKCPLCGSSKWITHDKFPTIRKCANPKCTGLHPNDALIKAEGQIWDMNKKQYIDFEDLFESMK